MEKSKYSYSVDGHNRLLIKSPGSKKAVSPNGQFRVTRDNGLSFWLNEPPSWRKENNLPKKITFTGTWQLDEKNGLEFILDKSRYQNAGEKISFKGKLFAVDGNSVAFSISSYKEAALRLSRIQTFRLAGLWQADKYNRLNFIISRKLHSDTLTFEGGWQINKNQQIVYICEKTGLKNKTRISEEVVLRGYWQIVNNRRLVYILSHNGDSCLEFRVQLETPNLYPQKGKIKFRLGVGLKKNRPPVPKTICLYGEWKFSHKWGLVFAMDYGAGTVHNIEFGFTVAVHNADSISVSLTNKQNEPLGITVTFTHRFLKEHGAQGFIRLKPERKRSGLEAGFTFPF
ncbi:MAG: hypothetical protein C4540_05445 [Candidatus Omnitrophota bacterium]|jgi:hypothetical protein|nr:MAG: hypothetical protein C4540_05445 [Candidatus Omnitrophota bacterium]